MRKIAIVGAGQAGCLAAHALLQRGYEVTLHSDKTPEQFLAASRPTGTAARFDRSLQFERELGLELWGDVAPRGDGVHLTFCPRPGNRLLTLLGRFERQFLAVDVRLQSATWLRRFAEQGGKVEIENVDLKRLDEIAAHNDLTLVAAGRRELQKLFARDEARSRYTRPQRQLAMIAVTGAPSAVPDAPWFTPIKFNAFATAGELFWAPWYSKGGQRAWCLGFEAREGGPIDRFREVKTVEQCLKTAREVIRELTPWDYEWLQSTEPCDENAWLVGAVLPEVRRVAGALPSGRVVMALGDTAHSLDPIGGQGANNGNKMARSFVEAIAARGEAPFDAAWMEQAMDRFWEQSRWTEEFNDTMLEPLPRAAQLLLTAQYGSTARPGDRSPQQQIADRFVANFDDPSTLTPALHDEARAREVIRAAYGSTVLPLAKGRLQIGRAQLRQKLGRPPAHPGTRA